MEQSQQERVLEKLNRDGEVNNFWAIEHYILRLGAIIHQLSKEGMQFKRAYGKELGKEQRLWKNYYYIKLENNQDKLL